MIGQITLVTALIALVSGCGISRYLPDFLVGEEEAEPPAPLVEFKPTVEIDTLWSEDVGGGAQYLKLAPVAMGTRIFTVDRKGEVSAIDAKTGEQLWEEDTDAPISSGPGVGEGLVLVGTKEGEVLALSQEQGAIVWKSQLSSEVLAAPKAAEGIAIARTLDGKVFGMDAASGSRLWVYDRQVPVLTLRGTSAPVLVNDLVIAGFDSGSLVALEIKTGKLTWETNIAQPRGRSELERMVDIDAEPVVFDDTIYVATFQGRIAAVSLYSGQIAWDRDLSSYAGIGVDSDNVYLTDEEDQIWALDRYSGASVWKQDKLHARSVTAPTPFGEYVVAGDLEGYLHWLRKEDGQFAARVRVNRSPIIVPPLATENALFALSSSGRLVAYRPHSHPLPPPSQGGG
jgi:outer membrane protein assembly factor BamB